MSALEDGLGRVNGELLVTLGKGFDQAIDPTFLNFSGEAIALGLNQPSAQDIHIDDFPASWPLLQPIVQLNRLATRLNHRRANLYLGVIGRSAHRGL